MIATHRHCFLTLLLMGISLLLCRPALSSISPTSLEQIHDLGVQSINGDGVPVDLAKGRYYIQQSALQGYPLGQYHLGILFFTGEGGPQNSACATWWLGKAIAANNEVRERAQQALNDIQEDITVTTEMVDEQRCQQYSYNLISLPIAKPVHAEPQVNAIELSEKGNHALLETLKSRPPHRIYTTLRLLQNKLTKMLQPIAQHRERLMLAAAHKARIQQQTIPAENKTVSDEPTEVVITLVLPPSKQKSKTEQVESMPIDMPSKPIEVTLPVKKNASTHTNLGGDIRAASPRHYTLQLGSAGSAEGLYERARRHKLSNYLVYETIRNGQQWYVLVYGEYPTMSAAKQALITLPRGIQKDKPWIRSLKQVQSELH
ncbi:SPOR domain-containing protein [Providencia alcalifaciens]|uniref:SPOR domain-containing protein n=1 Tax=Providencia alcalifaciens TaxID=126385 RepID=UPI001CE05B47|nr:SPOR domain-containing protein [Providencia alcalifaciens]UBX50470.1 SPOR domain-containing protein [Providencia alcalifaciens]